MASPFGNSESFWIKQEKLLNKYFDRIIDEVNKRRELVLSEMRDIRERIKHIHKSIQQLENVKLQIESEMTENLLSTTKKQQILEINTKISDLQLEACNSDIDYQFVFDDNEIQKALSTLGAFEKCPKQYLSKKIAKDAKFLGGNICNFSVHEESGLIALINENEIMYLNLNTGKIYNSLNIDSIFPVIAIEIINFEEILLSSSHSILRFRFNPRKKTSRQFISKMKQKTQSIVSIIYDKQTDQVYALSSTEHTLFILDRNLTVLSTSTLQFTLPLSLFVTEDKIYILAYNNPCLHIICKYTNTRIKSIVSVGCGLAIYRPVTFTVDRDGNIIICTSNNSIKVFSPSGQLLCSLPEDWTMNSDYGVISVFVTKDYKIIVLSKDHKIPIRIY